MMDDVSLKSTSKLTDEELVARAQADFKASREHFAEWRDDAREAFDFVAGKQWSEDDLAAMKEQLRPSVTFNRSEVFISAVTGLEALNRNEVKYLPRAIGPINNAKAQTWSAAADYVNEDSHAEFHHSHAFRDMVICGLGATLTRLDYDTHPDGQIAIERLNPLNVYPDPRATQRNCSDGRWVGYVEPWIYRDVVDEFGREKAEQIGPHGFFDPAADPTQPHNASQAWLYEGTQIQIKDADDVFVFRYQWCEVQPFMRLAANGKQVDVTEGQYGKLKEQQPELAASIQAVKLKRRKYYQALIAGNVVLERTELSCPDFSIQIMTGKYDQNDGVWYGLTRSLKDPQCWLNKLYSSLLYMISVNAKGGIMAERSAFDNPQEAERTWADPSKITWANDGALVQGKILPKPPLEYPAGMDRLMTVALEMFPGVTGANIELLGLAEKVQPGVLEAQRKQAGMTILAWAFDAMRHYRKRHGKVLAEYISKYLADGRLIRILGDDGNPQYIQLIKDQLALEYDVVVDEAPNSPNERERTFAVLMQLLPMLTKQGTMPLPPKIYDYMPIPASLAEEFRKQAQPDPQMQAAQQMMQQLQARGAQAEVAETESKAALNQAKAQETQAKVQRDDMKTQHDMMMDVTQ